jgi:membrane protein implicated in regulation of membrane protease activity
LSWWAWMIGGAILFGAELAFVDAQFYLVFVGSAAMLVGLLTAFTPVDDWAQWALFAIVASGSVVLFRGRIYRKLRGHAPEVRRGPSGDELTLPAALAPEQSCQAEHAGSFWTVQNDSEVVLSSGARVRVVRVEGLTLLVRPAA